MLLALRQDSTPAIGVPGLKKYIRSANGLSHRSINRNWELATVFNRLTSTHCIGFIHDTNNLPFAAPFDCRTMRVDV
jgi:hypothetical protein